MGFRTAPRRCAAWKSTTASARFGSTDETTSPGRTPRAASPAATRLQAPGRLVDEMAERVEVGPHVDTAVRDGLEAADRLAELVAGPGVVHRHGEGPLGRAGHVGEGGDGAAVERARERRPGRAG